MQKKVLTCLLILATLVISTPAALAAPPIQAGDGDVYVVQAGDTLFAIAQRLGVTAADLAAANDLSNPNFIFVGQQLIVPNPQPQAEPAIVATYDEQDEETATPASPEVYVVQRGDSLSAIATRFGLSVTELAAANGILDPDYLAVGQRLVIPTPGATAAQDNLPAPFVAIDLSPEPVLQGQTLVVRVTLSQPASLSGEFDGRPIFFSGDSSGGWALVGIHALQTLGAYSLSLHATGEDGTQSSTAVNVIVSAGPYTTEDIQLAPGRESLLDPQLIRAEQAHLVALWSQVSPRPLWEGKFRLPLASIRITSPYGTRRSYNGGPVSSFHEGTDFGAESGIPIYATASGRVVLAEKLSVRGNAVLIDHGLGVFSGYWHQSKLAVHVGQTVKAGDLIGYVGDTGLVTGAHLHWEMRVGGIAVDPMQWPQATIP
jgi:murein DD-endopeptidase MepM/ murein hydrolase activator NlpD